MSRGGDGGSFGDRRLGQDRNLKAFPNREPQAPPTEGFTPTQNSATMWRPSTQTREPMGHVSHPNHSTDVCSL